MVFPEFYFNYTVQISDIDENNHMNNVAYINLMNRVAEAYWLNAAPKVFNDLYFWIARRHEIDYLASSFLGEALRVKSWIGEPKGASWVRFYQIERIKDNTILAKAQTVWVMLHTVSQRPARLTDEIIQIFLKEISL